MAQPRLLVQHVYKKDSQLLERPWRYHHIPSHSFAKVLVSYQSLWILPLAHYSNHWSLSNSEGNPRIWTCAIRSSPLVCGIWAQDYKWLGDIRNGLGTLEMVWGHKKWFGDIRTSWTGGWVVDTYSTLDTSYTPTMKQLYKLQPLW